MEVLKMEKNKDFDAIMKEITSGLSGDSQTDLSYLREQMEKYKDHEMSKEIIRACGRLMYELIPDDKKEELAKIISNDSAGTESALEEVRFNIYKKDFNKALRIMEALVKKTEDLHAFEDDQVSEYHKFDEFFEEILYRYRAEPEKDLRPAQLPYTEIYLLYGSLLVEMKRYAEAQEALRKGLRWNPVSFNMTSEYIETYKVTGDLERFFSLTKDAFKIAFRSSDVARCYRNLGYYFVEKKLWSEATACYLLSLQYDHDSKAAQSELYFINSSTEGKIQEPSIDQAREYGEKYGFPIGADEDVIGLAVSYGKHFLEQGALNAAKYFLSIAYDLTGSDDILNIIEQLPKDTKE
jgi:tetratricopeptide (TPR) repeat protein